MHIEDSVSFRFCHLTHVTPLLVQSVNEPAHKDFKYGVKMFLRIELRLKILDSKDSIHNLDSITLNS